MASRLERVRACPTTLASSAANRLRSVRKVGERLGPNRRPERGAVGLHRIVTSLGLGQLLEACVTALCRMERVDGAVVHEPREATKRCSSASTTCAHHQVAAE